MRSWIEGCRNTMSKKVMRGITATIKREWVCEMTFYTFFWIEVAHLHHFTHVVAFHEGILTYHYTIHLLSISMFTLDSLPFHLAFLGGI